MRTRSLLFLASLLPILLGAKPPARPAQATLLVATRDLAVGEVVTEADVAELQVDKEWAPPSLVGADSKQYILNQRLVHPMLKGDTFMWALFETTKDSTPRERCARAAALPRTALEQVARSRQVLLEREQ